jgi:uncharacterized protein YdhG (YjbR/CyaY superfamily)
MATKSPAKSATPRDASLSAYLDSFPPATRKVLDKIRATVRKAVPDAEEMRSYGVGAFKRGGTYVLYYAGYPKHVSIYPVYAGDPGLGEALKPYTSGKATAKFSLDQPIPYDLIANIVRAKVAEHGERLEQRARTRKGPAGKAARAALKKAPAKKATVKKKASKKAAKKGPVKTAAPKKAGLKATKAFKEMPNLSWSLLKDVAPKKKSAAKKKS